MLKLHNVRIKPSNVRKKSKDTTKCEKRTVTCDIGTAKCEDGAVKCEKKVREPPNVIKKTVTRDTCDKKLSHVTKIEQMRYWNCLI